VFGVPWQWHAERVAAALNLIADCLSGLSTFSLPNLFVQGGLVAEISWLEELLDSEMTIENVRQVMLGCNPRSVAALFKRYLVSKKKKKKKKKKYS
jgi:hypothetical protein